METETPRRIAHRAVEAAIKAIVRTRLKTQTDSMLKTFLAFKAIHRDGPVPNVETSNIKSAVEELFTVLPTPPDVPEDKFSGTIDLRGQQGQPHWLRNDTYRGSFLDYAGPSSPGRFLFEDEDWRKPLLGNAVDKVVKTLGNGPYTWPPGEALAAIALRNEDLDPAFDWDELLEAARSRFGLSLDEWGKITSAEPLEVDPFDGDQWNPDALHASLCPPGVEKAQVSEKEIEDLPDQLRTQVERVQTALEEHGHCAVVALAGVPGTSKSHTARIAARAYASVDCLREIQFSPGYTYEEFIEGPRYEEDMRVEVVPGGFLELNERAFEDPGHQYVLLIEEFTRADVPRVFGELLTYVEYREERDSFTTMYTRNRTVRIAPNIAILATYNPSDRSAVNVDAALARRMRVLDFPPSTDLLEEILTDNGVDAAVIAKLTEMFDACREQVGDDRFSETMPFGHAVFAAVQDEKDLHDLWHEQLKRILVRPHTPRNEFYDIIAEHYPWISADRSVVGSSSPMALEEK